MAPYLQILIGAAIMVSFWTVFRSIIVNMHMFQLNGYRTSTHVSWMWKNRGRYAMEGIVLLLSLTGLLRNERMMGFAASALLIALCALVASNRSRQAKKPLAYTARVKRMLATTVLLFALTLAGAIVCLAGPRKDLAFLVIGLMNALAPLYILLANGINKPMELSINRHYTNDAKRMLKDAKNLETVGITGSYGKTSVKFYLYTILRGWTDTLVTPESFNTPMGVVKTVRGSLKSVHKIFLCEMGAKWVGDIRELCDIVHPRHGIITALGDQHLESFGSVEKIIKTKYELADALPPDGRLYVNWDNDRIREHPPARPFIRYGTREDCDYRAFDIRVSSAGTAFRVQAPDGTVQDFETRLLGGHCAVNITGAIACANGFGMTLPEMAGPVRRIESVTHRMQILEKGGLTVIDDAYNSNPAGCAAALETLSRMEGERILVTPGMVELGEKEYELNRAFGEQAVSACDHIVLVGEKQTAPIQEGVRAAGGEAKLYVAPTFADGMRYVHALQTDKKKIVLLENDLPDNY